MKPTGGPVYDYRKAQLIRIINGGFDYVFPKNMVKNKMTWIKKIVYFIKLFSVYALVVHFLNIIQVCMQA